jgi:hypothetical protein
MKVKAAPDPTFDFATVHTWAWDADAGDVIMARTASDDPAPVKARVDPLIRKYVEGAMAKKGLTDSSAVRDGRIREAAEGLIKQFPLKKK